MGPEDTSDVDTALHEAVRFADIDDVKEALKSGHSPNQIGLYQWAPVHEAAHNGELDILRLLLSHGGDANVTDELRCRTPLHYASEENHSDCVALLLAAGGDCHAPDTAGHTPLGLAAQQCRLLMCSFSEKLLDSSREAVISPSPQTAPHMRTSPEDDTVSVSSDCTCSSVTSACSSSYSKTSAEIGQIELSFEYDSRKSSLRIRVWQVSDLFLPPAETSTINSLYVKSLLIPDNSRSTKRKTEEVKVSQALTHVKNSPNAVSQTTGLASFKFTKPLDYAGISKQDIQSKTIQLEVCLTQKYTRKSYLVSMLRLPCKTAVRRLVREKYPLIPCDNPTIPETMRLRSVERLSLRPIPRIYHSNPNLRTNSQLSLNSNGSGYPASESALENIAVLTADHSKVPNIVVTIPCEHDTDDELREVKAGGTLLPEMHLPKSTHVEVDLDNGSLLREVTTSKSDKSASDSAKIDLTEELFLQNNYPKFWKLLRFSTKTKDFQLSRKKS